MTCKLCGTVPAISKVPGEAFFTCNVDILQNKLLNILTAEGYTPVREGEVVKVKVENFQQLLTCLSGRDDIANVEADGLHLLFLGQGEQLDFAAFSRTKSLKKWFFY